MTTDASLTCPGCGAPMGDGAGFCLHCGDTAAAADHWLAERLAEATAGEYRILTELGRGGMAAVFLAEDLALARRVAIKVMIPDLGGAAGMADRFLLEARTAAQLAHPNITPIYAVRTTGRLRFFVMKYIAGRSLDRVLAETGPLDPRVVQAILAQVGSALEHAHARGVVHRDIKPANIMLDADGSAIVADFGIAKVAHGVGLTQSGLTVGTPSYMSPEQCTGRSVTGASDQYALGCVAFELIAGRPPFVHEEVVPVLLAHVSDPPPPLLQYRFDCPLELAAAIDKMLAKDPADRWPSLAEAIAAAEAGPQTTDPAVRQMLRDLAGVESADAIPSLPSIPVSPVPAPRTVVRSPRLSINAPATSPVVSKGELRVIPGSGSLSVGQVVRLQAAVTDDRGALQAAAGGAWSSSDPTILRVTSDGELTAFRPGAARIFVSVGTLTAEVGYQVTRVDAAKVRIAPQLTTLGVGEQVLLQAEASDQLGTPLSGRVVAWSSSRPEIATMGPDGVLRGVAPGAARVSASVGGGIAVLEVRVTPANVTAVRLDPPLVLLAAGESASVRAEVHTARGALAGATVEWQSSDPTVATVSADGLVTGLRFGIARIAASAAGRRATIPVEVRAPSLVSAPRLSLRAP